MTCTYMCVFTNVKEEQNGNNLLYIDKSDTVAAVKEVIYRFVYVINT